MTRNWYAVYIRPQKEKKVISLLSKKGIENFCPFIVINGGRSGVKKPVEQPLFTSVVFVHIRETDIKSLISFPWVVTVAYWKTRPAVISDSEIEIVKKVTETYSDIRLEKGIVQMGSTATVIDTPDVEYNENTISIKYKSVKVNLPSLGYTLIAERIKQKREEVYQQPGLFTSFPRRINAFFFN